MDLGLCLGENGRRESRQLAFPQLPLAVQPIVSNGLPFDQLFLHHVLLRHGRERVFILAEVPIGPDPLDIPPVVKKLHEALGPFPYSTWYAMVTGGWHEVIHIVRQMREFAADALVVVGGDVVIDLAKVVLYAYSSLVEDEEEMLEVLMKPTPTEMNDSGGERLLREDRGCRPPLDFFCVPTTCGGAAYTQQAYGFNEASQACCTLIRTMNYPRVVIQDGQATLATPIEEWNRKGAEAINHAVEGILSVNAHPHMVGHLTEAFKLLCVGLLGTKSHPQNITARNMALRGANVAMTPLACRPEVAWGASHAFCNAAQRLFFTEPGLMAAVMLPPVIEWYAIRIRCQPSPEAYHKMRAQHHALLMALWEPKVCRDFFLQQGFEQDGSDVGHLLRALFHHLDLPSHLSTLGIARKSQRERLAVAAALDPCARSAPVRLMHPNHAHPILERVKGEEEPEDAETPTQQ